MGQKKNVLYPRVVLAKVARMMYYQWQCGDCPHGSFKFLEEMEWIDGVANISENTLFCVDDDCCYGIVQTKFRDRKENVLRNLRIEKIDGYFSGNLTPNPSEISGVTVIWCIPPDGHYKNEVNVVGWYKNATIYREFVEEDERFYNVCAAAKDCVLLPTAERDKRRWSIPQIAHDDLYFGQSMHKFPKSNNPIVKTLLGEINSYEGENWTGKFS